MSFTFHSDAGHGWVEVTLDDIYSAGLNPEDFSAYSYRDGNKFFLEEDMDGSMFHQAYTARVGKISYNESYQENSFIRSLPRLK